MNQLYPSKNFRGMHIPLLKGICLILLICLLEFENAIAQSTISDFKNEPTLSWKFHSAQPFIASPMANGGTIYIGGLDSNLYALDASNGNIRWKFKTRGPIRSNVLIENDNLFLNGGDGNLYCLDKNSGKTNWVFKSKGEKHYDFADYFQSSPILYQQTIYFGSGDSNVYAITEKEGKLIWRYKTSGVVHATPAISDNKLFVGSFDGYFYALNISDGSLIWKFKSVGERYFPKGEFQGSTVAAKGLVFAGNRDFNLYALDMNEGYCHWNTSFTGGWAMALTLSANDSILYIGTSDDRLLIAADVFTGKEIWKTKVGFNIFGPCILSSSMCYAGTLLGKMYGLDLKTGTIQWTFTDDGYKKNHLNYFKEDDSYRDDIHSLIKSNDDYIKWMYDIGAIFSSPAISNDIIVVSSTDGTIYGLKRK